MAGGPSSLAVSKSRSKTSKRRSNYTESSRHSSLLDTDIGMEGWPVPESSSSGKEVKKEVEEKAKAEQQTTMGQLLDLEEQSTEPVETMEKENQAAKKSLMQQLYELQGLEVDALTTTTTTTTTTTITSIKAKPTSTTTSSEHSTETKKHHDQIFPQLTTIDNLPTKDLSLTEPHYDSEQPSVATPTNKVPSTPASASVSNEQDPTPDTITNANNTPSSPSTIPQPFSPPSPPATQPAAQLGLQTLRSQELALETNGPLGTEISAWAAAIDTVPSSSYNTDEKEGETEKPDGGYIRRFATRKGKTSDTEPNKENAMVKWDPFGGVWGYAVNKKVWVVEEEKKKKEPIQVDVKKDEKETEGMQKGTEQMQKDIKEQKEEEKKETCFDNLESFWSKRDEKPAKKDDDVRKPEKKHSNFDELEMFMNS